MRVETTRRAFLARASFGLAVAGLGLAPRALVSGKDRRPEAPAHDLTVISGKPRDRGRAYGVKFKDPIRSFLDREILAAFASEKHPTKDEMLRYAAACAKEVRSYSPIVFDELEGMAEGSGLRIEEAVLITLHEELWHRGVLPAAEHCTAVALGPEEGQEGSTFVGQTWDWMESVYGLSTMLHWKREEGPSLLAYAYPGLWAGAGLSSAGVALTWTSAGSGGPRVGIPSYVLIAHMLYQESLEAALDEARRARNAGFFTFVLGDGEGRLANVEGSPAGIAVEEGRGRLVRHNYGSRKMTGAPEGKAAPVNERCGRVNEILDKSSKADRRAALDLVFGDAGIGGGALDVIVFDATRREAHVSRGPGDLRRWKRFTF